MICRVKLLLFFILLIMSIPFSSLAQFRNSARLINQTKFYSNYSYSSPSELDTVQLEFPITSMVFSISSERSFEGTFITTGSDTFYLSEDTHEMEDDKTKYSELLIFDQPINFFILHKKALIGRMNFHLLNSGKTPLLPTQSVQKRSSESCGKPQTVSQSIWRSGLTSPNYTPAYSTVKHIIVHHAAGSNTDNNYTNVVRQIYLYHTEVRKYSDIAYNFLIAQDGTIFDGREGFGENKENVIGAHFCAKNTETMGICLLGNYETATPPATMLTSLEQLMAWKLAKENLNTFGTGIHQGTSLGIVAGHRDGCATECPGKFVYEKLNEIKTRTEEAKIRLAPAMPKIIAQERQGPGSVVLKVSGTTEGNYLWFFSPNPNDSIPGAKGSTFITPHLAESKTYYVAIKNNDCISEMTEIEARIRHDEFVIFPNPADHMVTIVLDGTFVPYYISVINSLGQKVRIIDTNVEDDKISFDVSSLAKGMYFLRVKSVNKTLTSRLLLH